MESASSSTGKVEHRQVELLLMEVIPETSLHMGFCSSSLFHYPHVVLMSFLTGQVEHEQVYDAIPKTHHLSLHSSSLFGMVIFLVKPVAPRDC